MPEEPPARSGSRWEPPADDRPDPSLPLQSGEPEPTARSRRDRLGRPVAAVAAAGVLAAIGVGGFAVGRATGQDHRPVPTSVTRDGGTGGGGEDGGPWGDHGQRGDGFGQDPDGQGGPGFQDGPGFPEGQGAPDGGTTGPDAGSSDGPAVGT